MQEARLIPETQALAASAAPRTETLSSQHEASRLKRPERAQAQVSIIRLKLLKVAARVMISSRRIVLHLASPYSRASRAVSPPSN